MRLSSLLCIGAMASARVSPGTIIDDSPLVVVYYENWAGWVRKFSPSHVEKNILSRDMPVRNFVMNYAFYSWNYEECSLIPVDSIDLQKGDQGGWTPDDWNIDSLESWATSKPVGGHIPAFMMLKSYYPHIKLLPSIGGWSRSHTYHDCVNHKMDHMVDSVMNHIIAWGWDGIDLDWEYPNCDGKPCGCQNEAACSAASGFSNVAGPGDWELYKTFVKKVRQRFNDLEDQLGRRLYITAALGMNPKLVEGNNEQWSVPMPMEWICGEDDLDWVNLMAYDFYGPWEQTTGPLAPLYPEPDQPDQMSIDDSLTKMLKRCSRPEKLTMGLATYGKSWKDVPNTGTVPGLWQKSTAADPRAGGTWEMGTLSYFDLKKTVIPGCTRTWDPVSQTPTLYCAQLPDASDLPYDEKTGKMDRSQKNVFISYEDGESWRVKMAYAKSKGMAGAIIWAASDTGSGDSFAPDSTVDLFEGLFEGWFGEKRTLPATTSLKASPGSVTRPPNYPCPMVTGWPTGPKSIDMSRCEGMTYPVGGSYFMIPKASPQSDIGKDKILIHPLQGAVDPSTAPAVTTVGPSITDAPDASCPACDCPSTECPTCAPMPTCAPPTTCPPENTCPPVPVPPTTAPSTTSAGAAVIPAVMECQASFVAENAQRMGFCRDNCLSAYNYQLCEDLESAGRLAQCVASVTSVCNTSSDERATTTTTTPPPMNAVNGCQSLVSSANSNRLSLCQRNCATVVAHQACPNLTSAQSVASCVAEKFAYCSLA